MSKLNQLALRLMPMTVRVAVAAFVALYCANIYKLTQCDFKPPYGQEAVRAVGTFIWPLGIVMGLVPGEDHGNGA